MPLSHWAVIFKGVHTGNFGSIGTFSFNGNKTITSGGGGALITNDEALAKRAKHLTTQAKLPHSWRFTHDEIGYNFRLPNLNAALLCAQLEQLNSFLENKRELASIYETFFRNTDITFVKEIGNATANYWLNTLLLNNQQERDDFLKTSNENGVMTRPRVGFDEYTPHVC
jgi:perosamine synthetase